MSNKKIDGIQFEVCWHRKEQDLLLFHVAYLGGHYIAKHTAEASGSDDHEWLCIKDIIHVEKIPPACTDIFTVVFKDGSSFTSTLKGGANWSQLTQFIAPEDNVCKSFSMMIISSKDNESISNDSGFPFNSQENGHISGISSGYPSLRKNANSIMRLIRERFIDLLEA